jgi:hypothetical protein
MKPATTASAVLLMLIGIGHLLRLVFHVRVVVNDLTIPLWPSIIAFVVFITLAVLVWREHRTR